MNPKFSALTMMVFIALCLATPRPGRSEASRDFEVSVWLNRHLMARGEEAIVEFIDAATSAGATSIMPNYWFHGRVIYPGSKYVSQHADFEGWDPMAVVMREASRHGLKVYPWFEYGFFTHFTRGDMNDPGPILAEHPELITINKAGQNGLRNTGMGVTHYSLNPGHPEAREYLAELALEVLEKYPGAAGINLDRIRYQGADWSYDPYSRAKFKAEAGIDPLEIPAENAELNARWKRWREDQVNEFMEVFAAKFRARHPEKLITAAVVPPYMKEDKYQRWEEWLRDGTLDVAVPMVYGGPELVRREVQQSMQLSGDGAVVWAGIDAAVSAPQLLESIRAANALGARGVVFWNEEQFLLKEINFGDKQYRTSAVETPASQPVVEQPHLY